MVARCQTDGQEPGNGLLLATSAHSLAGLCYPWLAAERFAQWRIGLFSGSIDRERSARASIPSSHGSEEILSRSEAHELRGEPGSAQAFPFSRSIAAAGISRTTARQGMTPAKSKQAPAIKHAALKEGDLLAARGSHSTVFHAWSLPHPPSNSGCEGADLVDPHA